MAMKAKMLLAAIAIAAAVGLMTTVFIVETNIPQAFANPELKSANKCRVLQHAPPGSLPFACF